MDHIDAFIKRTGAVIRHGTFTAPYLGCYYPAEDVIQIRPIATFESRARYYATVFHELIHFTGPRLKRVSGIEGTDAYKEEEVIACIGAASLADEFDLPLNRAALVEYGLGYFFRNEWAEVSARLRPQADQAIEYLLSLTAKDPS